MKTLVKVTFQQTSDGWFTSVYAYPGCHAEGATLELAREKTLLALAYFIDDMSEVELTEVFK